MYSGSPASPTIDRELHLRVEHRTSVLAQVVRRVSHTVRTQLGETVEDVMGREHMIRGAGAMVQSQEFQEADELNSEHNTSYVSLHYLDLSSVCSHF